MVVNTAEVLENSGKRISDDSYFELFYKLQDIRQALDAAFKKLEGLNPDVLPF